MNVGGSKNVIKACIRHGVGVLVYTSTTNVVFSGNALPNKDESQPYLPLHKHIDAYSRSKAMAEQVTMRQVVLTHLLAGHISCQWLET